jgi:anti-anti-sigma factor
LKHDTIVVSLCRLLLAFTEFNAASRRDRDRAVVRLDGELDCSTEGLARVEIEIALERGGVELVVDLRGLNFIDARGVRLLVDARSACRSLGRRLTVIPGPEPVQRVFELCNVDFALAEPLSLAA